MTSPNSDATGERQHNSNIYDYSGNGNHSSSIGDSNRNAHHRGNEERGTDSPHTEVVGGGGGGNAGNSDECSDGGVDRDTKCHSPDSVTSQTTTKYTVTKVRLMLLLVTTLCSAGFTTRSVIAQYLLDRWSEESGHNSSRVLNGSSPGRGGSLCDRNESDPWVIAEDDIQSKVSIATMYYSLATSLPALLSCLFYGALVDMVGRKPALISSIAGFAGQILVTVLIIRFKLDPNFFYLAYALDGIGGSFFVNLIACFSITADISRKKDTRVLGIAILTLVGASTFAVVNVMTGLLIKKVGYIAASSAVLAPVCLSLFAAIFLLPETLPMRRQKVTARSVWNYTTRLVFMFTRDGDVRTRRCLTLCLLLFFTGVMNMVNVGGIDTLYQKHTPLCWDSAQLGYYSAFRNSGGYTLSIICLCAYRWCGCASDEVLAMVGMLFVAGSFVLESFVVSAWQMYMVPVVSCPGANIAAIVRGVMSILAGPEKQGVMFSSVAMIESMCSLVATVAYNKIYAITVDFMPGFVYLVMAGVALSTFFLFIPFFHYYDGPPKYERLIQTPDDTADGSVQASEGEDA